MIIQKAKGVVDVRVLEHARIVGEYLRLVKEYKDGKAEVEDVVKYIDVHPELKELFILQYLRNTADEIRSFSLKEHIDGYGYFKPYCKKIDELITEFADYLKARVYRG